MGLTSWLEQVTSRRARLAVLGAALLLAVAPFFPLWQITMFAGQFPEGLRMWVYAYKVVGGNADADLQGINILNHYIGMKEITAADFWEMRAIPFAIGIFFLISLRTIVFAKVRDLVDQTVMFLYFSAFSFGVFWYRMYTYGHQLNPRRLSRSCRSRRRSSDTSTSRISMSTVIGVGTVLLLVAGVGLLTVLLLEWRQRDRAQE
jgi:hypothetical protein